MRIHRIAYLAAMLAVSALPFGDGMAARAESLTEALALAYSNNPTINAQRASTRAVDENIAIAKSAKRPTITAAGELDKTWSRSSGVLVQQVPPVRGTVSSTLVTGGFGVTISQTLFDGFKSDNGVAAAEAAVQASRETLRNVEQNTLFDAVAAYMDVIRDGAISGYRAQALEFLNEQVRSERARFEVGESTRTDVSQAEARRALAEAQRAQANASLKSSIAVYRQVVGKNPDKLKMPGRPSKLMPRSLDQAVGIAMADHPAILATQHLVDQALFNVKSAEGDLLPRVVLEGNVSRALNPQGSGTQRESASVTAKLSVPIYQGGRVSAQVRQNKETLGQRRIEVDEAVDNVRAAVVSAWSQLEAAAAQIEAIRAQLNAARLALQGAIEERKVGQRTTLDVLNTQQEVINAQISLASAERDVIVASYAVLSATGKLNASSLGLQVARYDPEDHYIAVKDKWYGLRTPDGQ